MRKALDTVPIDGTIVIGEGERDEAPMLYIGEKVGLAITDRKPPTNGGGRGTWPCKGAGGWYIGRLVVSFEFCNGIVPEGVAAKGDSTHPHPALVGKATRRNDGEKQ
jgi:hypothetical protein